MKAILEQEITSAATSIRHVPRLHKLINVRGRRVLDYGCGKYNDGENYLYEQGAEEVALWDPWNRDPEENVEAACWVHDHSADIVLCSNVLNVLQDREVRLEVIRDCWKALKPGQYSAAYFTVYEGDKSGVGRRTVKGWQENRRSITYLAEIRTCFKVVEIFNKVMKGIRK